MKVYQLLILYSITNKTNTGETMLKKTMDIKDKAMSTLKASNNELIAIIQKQINLRCLARYNILHHYY